MQNASLAALIYEFLFDVYRLMETERGHNKWLPDEHGVLREPFFHWYISCWEWSTSVLEEVGATKTLPLPKPVNQDAKPTIPSPYSYPAMSLEECRAADFSEFETFDNYCYAMFTLNQLIHQTSGLGDEVDLELHSPRFLEAVAEKDDVFEIEIEDIVRVKLNRQRFDEKVMTRWREMDVRGFRRGSSV